MVLRGNHTPDFFRQVCDVPRTVMGSMCLETTQNDIYDDFPSFSLAVSF